MTRMMLSMKRGHLRRERSHAVPEGFTALRPFPSHYEFAAMFAAFADLVTVHELDGTVRFAVRLLPRDSGPGSRPGHRQGARPQFFAVRRMPSCSPPPSSGVRGGDDNADVTFRCQTQDSQARWLETRIGLLKGVNGSATGFVAVSRLVTDRVELERGNRICCNATARSQMRCPG